MRLKIPYWYLLLGPSLLYYIGAAMNLGVMAINHGQMPVMYPGGIEGAFTSDIYHSTMTSSTHLKILCDWIQLNGEGIASLGDILLWTGMKYQEVSLAIWAALIIKDYNWD